MTQISKATFNTTYADPAGTFADNTTRDITEGNMRQFAEDIKDSCLFKLDNVINKVTGTISSAQLLTLGSVPVTIISAPGANKYLNIISVCVSYNYGSVAYDFSNAEPPTFLVGSGNATHQIPYTIMNGGADFNGNVGPFNTGASSVVFSPTNTALTLTTAAGTDPSTGDGDLDVVVWYTIEGVNV